MQDTAGALPDQADLMAWRDMYSLTYPVLGDDGTFVSQYLQPVGEEFSTYIIDTDGSVAWVEYGESTTTDDRARDQLLLML